MNERMTIYGLMAEFSHERDILLAAKCAHREGYRKMDAYTPFPIDGLAECLGRRKSIIPLIVLVGGIFGGLGGYLMQWYATTIDYPINVGGRPFNSWPMYIPITFEMTILSAALAGFIGMFVLNKLPEPHHPVFNTPNFERASIDRFYLCIEATDPKFDLAATRRFLQSFDPGLISEVAK